MSYYTIPLKAGMPVTQNIAGNLLLIDSIGAAPGVDVQLIKASGSTGNKMPARQAAFRIVEPFAGVIFTASVDTTIGVFLSSSDVSLGLTAGSAISLPDGAKVTNSDAEAIPIRAAVGQRLPVDIGGGTVTVTADNVGISNTDANPVPVKVQSNVLPKTLVDLAPAAVGLAAAEVSADAALLSLRFRNAHATAKIYLGGAGVTIAAAAICLNPGETWIESDAPGASWYAISDTAGADLRMLGVKA